MQQDLPFPTMPNDRKSIFITGITSFLQLPARIRLVKQTLLKTNLSLPHYTKSTIII